MSVEGAVVGVVTSAGGLDALTRLLGPLPATFPAPIVALQHQQPDWPSQLVSILASRTTLGVRVAADGELLRAGVVHVAPPGWHTLIRGDHTTMLIPGGVFPPSRPSGDLLLASLALSVGPEAIAVVLSGTGSDGATGASAVHACGGTVVVSAEASSEHFGMPSATIARHRPDYVIDLDEIPELLQRLIGIRRPVAP